MLGGLALKWKWRARRAAAGKPAASPNLIMGPVQELKTSGGKFFAGCYALYSGLVVVLASGIVLAPLAHRLLHRFNADDDD